MLSKSLKSEHDKRIESILNRLKSISYNPENLELIADLDTILGQLGYTHKLLIESESQDVVVHINKFNLGYITMEALADQFVAWGEITPELKNHSKALYAYIQNNSCVFSMNIMQKLSKL